MLMCYWRWERLQLTKNFKTTEFRSRDYPVILIDTELLKVLQGIRDAFGKPVNINSGFRSQNHNTDVGGSYNSAHLMGKAADISIPNVPAKQIAQVASALYGKKIAIGLHEKEDYVHIDVLYSGNWYREKLSNKVVNFND